MDGDPLGSPSMSVILFLDKQSWYVCRSITLFFKIAILPKIQLIWLPWQPIFASA